MKRFKTFLAVAIAFVMAITMIPGVNNGGNEVKAASFSITSPANNTLKPAGHIYIKWSQASGSVNHYELYVQLGNFRNIDMRYSGYTILNIAIH